jgi:hypothetical protein
LLSFPSGSGQCSTLASRKYCLFVEAGLSPGSSRGFIGAPFWVEESPTVRACRRLLLLAEQGRAAVCGSLLLIVHLE